MSPVSTAFCHRAEGAPLKHVQCIVYNAFEPRHHGWDVAASCWQQVSQKRLHIGHILTMQTANLVFSTYQRKHHMIATLYGLSSITMAATTQFILSCLFVIMEVEIVPMSLSVGWLNMVFLTFLWNAGDLIMRASALHQQQALTPHITCHHQPGS